MRGAAGGSFQSFDFHKRCHALIADEEIDRVVELVDRSPTLAEPVHDFLLVIVPSRNPSVNPSSHPFGLGRGLRFLGM